MALSGWERTINKVTGSQGKCPELSIHGWKLAPQKIEWPEKEIVRPYLVRPCGTVAITREVSYSGYRPRQAFSYQF